jgi:hypothetical protein
LILNKFKYQLVPVNMCTMLIQALMSSNKELNKYNNIKYTYKLHSSIVLNCFLFAAVCEGCGNGYCINGDCV